MFKNYDIAPEEPKIDNEKLLSDPIPASSYLDDLLDAIDEEEVNELGISPDKPLEAIVNRDQAEYFTKLWKKALRDKDEVNETVDGYLAKKRQQAEAFRERETKKLDCIIEYCSKLLRPYAEARAAETKKKSVSLLEGTLSIRKQPDSYSYDDEKLKLMFKGMTDGSKYLKPQEPKVDHAGLKKAGKVMNGKFYLDGKLVEGVLITQKPDKLMVS